MKKLFFHVMTLDSDMGSLGVISGSSNEELNTELRKALHSAFDAEAISFEEVDFGFWEGRHSKDVEVLFVDEPDGDETFDVTRVIELTYTWLV